MNNAGSADSGNRWLLAAAVLAIAAVICGFTVGPQAAGVIYGLTSPPDAPVPPDVYLFRHENDTYGVDRWSYATTSAACDVVAFYEATEGMCVLEPDWCVDKVETEKYADPVAVCEGARSFSLFHMRWEATITAGYPGDRPTRFELSRTIFWSAIPPTENF